MDENKPQPQVDTQGDSNESPCFSKADWHPSQARTRSLCQSAYRSIRYWAIAWAGVGLVMLRRGIPDNTTTWTILLAMTLIPAIMTVALNRRAMAIVWLVLALGFGYLMTPGVGRPVCDPINLRYGTAIPPGLRFAWDLDMAIVFRVFRGKRKPQWRPGTRKMLRHLDINRYHGMMTVLPSQQDRHRTAEALADPDNLLAAHLALRWQLAAQLHPDPARQAQWYQDHYHDFNKQTDPQIAATTAIGWRREAQQLIEQHQLSTTTSTLMQTALDQEAGRYLAPPEFAQACRAVTNPPATRP